MNEPRDIYAFITGCDEDGFEWATGTIGKGFGYTTVIEAMVAHIKLNVPFYEGNALYFINRERERLLNEYPEYFI